MIALTTTAAEDCCVYTPGWEAWTWLIAVIALLVLILINEMLGLNALRGIKKAVLETPTRQQARMMRLADDLEAGDDGQSGAGSPPPFPG
tara:strand:- start:3836 stop:4105 length:270 start_codon:yes stop_codon:yes gene_type:complete